MMMMDQQQDEKRRHHWKIRLDVLLITAIHVVNQLVLFSSFIQSSPDDYHHQDMSQSRLSAVVVSSEFPASSPPQSQPAASLSSTTTTSTVVHRDQQQQQQQGSPAALYSYASIIGGCNPDKPGYRGYLYTVLMSWQILRQQGSKADFCLYIQMSNQYTKRDNVLPKKEREMLQQVGIQVYYIPKVEKESFYGSMMDKFQILNLTQYRRVLFLDADLLALGNLDYLFEMSDNNSRVNSNSNNNVNQNSISANKSSSSSTPPLLQPNLVLAGALEPASGGFFMLEPGIGKLQHLQKILAERDAQNKTGRYFNTTEGWGHVIASTADPWKSTKKQGIDWGFPGSHADQGLLYHWVKYVERNVSLVIGDVVENWSNDMLQTTLENPFQQYQPSTVFYNECLRWKQRHCVNPYKSIVHYTGRSKPWLAEKPPANIGINNTAIKKTYWWYRLSLLNDELDMGLDFDHWQPLGNPTLGFVPAVQN